MSIKIIENFNKANKTRAKTIRNIFTFEKTDFPTESFELVEYFSVFSMDFNHPSTFCN